MNDHCFTPDEFDQFREETSGGYPRGALGNDASQASGAACSTETQIGVCTNVCSAIEAGRC